jgi:signal transduction histidine kinase
MTYRRHSLAAKLGLGILLLTIPIFIVSMGILFLQSRYIVRQEAVGRATSALATTMQHVSNYLGTIETATNANAWLVTERLHPDSLQAFSQRVVLFNHNVDGCSISGEPFLFPQQGRYFSVYTIRRGDSIVTMREGAYEYFDLVWYRTPRKLGAPCWIDPFRDHADEDNDSILSTNDVIASYCRPLYRPDSTFAGIISTDLSLRRLALAINSLQPYPHSYYMMVGKQGNYFVHPDSSRLFSHTIFSDADPSRHADVIALGYEMTDGHNGQMSVTLDGQRCLVCYRPIPNTQWSLALVCPESDILRGYHRLTFIILLLTAAGMAVILFFCISATGHITHPLEQLESLAQHIAFGQFDVEIPRSTREDEIGRLQNSFAAMQQSIDRHVGAIQKANQEAEERNAELARATLMAQEAGRRKTAFIQNVTHEIRTPLNIIGGFAQVLRDELAELSEDETQDISQMMKKNATTLMRIVLMLFDSSETGTSEELASADSRQPVGCNQLIRECIEQTHDRFPQLHVSFETEADDALTIRTSHLYLSRSILELLYNAAKFSDGQHIVARVTETDSSVRFIIQDTGPGIPPTTISHMYEAFIKGDDLSQGLGLGLPLTQRHCRNLGGSLTLDTDYQEGCRFIIELPKE